MLYQNKTWLLGSLTVTMLFMLACLGLGGNDRDPAESVNLRIINISNREISKAWLGNSDAHSQRVYLTETVNGHQATDYIALAPDSAAYSLFAASFADGETRANVWLKDAILASGATQDPDLFGATLEVGKYYTLEVDFRDPPENFSDGIPTIIED